MNSSPVQPIAPAPKKSKTWIIVVVVLLLLCCLCTLITGIGGYFYYQTNSSEISGLDETIQTFFPTSQANEVRTAETVRMEAGGYSFTQPPDYEVLSLMEDFGIIILEIRGEDWETTEFEVGAGPQIGLGGYENFHDWTLEEYAEHGKDIVIAMRTGATSSAPQEVTIAGARGIAYDYLYELPVAGTIYYRDIYVMVNPDQLFNIYCFSPVAAWDKTLADMNAIINSITFFEPVPAPGTTP